MKQLLLSLVFGFALMTLNAQSYKIYLKGTTTEVTGGTITVDSVMNGDMYQVLVCDDIEVFNISGNTLHTICTRTVISAATGSENSFCWGSGCFASTQSTSPAAQSPYMSPGSSSNTFKGDYKPNNVQGSTTVEYRFYDNSNSSDFAMITVIYTATSPTGINESVKDVTVSPAFPNPASGILSVKYDMNDLAGNAKIVMYDMLGKKVKVTDIMEREGTAKINISDLNAGVYFYTFMIDNKAISTKKVVVSSK